VSRLKSTQCGISVQSLIDWYNNQPDQPDDSQFVSGESASLQVMELKYLQFVSGASRQVTELKQAVFFKIEIRERLNGLLQICQRFFFF
jgi:hypothetical protein